MDFLIHKFSDWLNSNKLSHELKEVKGGYIIRFIDPDENLKKVIRSLFITIDTGKEEKGVAVMQPVNIFTSSGDSIIIEEKHYAEVLNMAQPAIRNYIYYQRKS